MPPVCSLSTPTSVTSAAATRMFAACVPRYPGDCTLIVYEPGGRFGISNPPSAPLKVLNAARGVS